MLKLPLMGAIPIAITCVPRITDIIIRDRTVLYEQCMEIQNYASQLVPRH
jgi:hypothetical protein